MKRCIIITGYVEGSIRRICPGLFDDETSSADRPLLLCADGGYRLAQREGLIPHTVIGDFDTFADQKKDRPAVCGFDGQDGEIIRVPEEKDDSDTMLCIKYGLKYGCDSFLLVGGIGGRLDHTFANLQALAWLTLRGKEACMKDEENCVMMKGPGAFSLRPGDFPPYRRFSLFSFSPSCEGVFIRGAKYPVNDGRLEFSFPLGVSNEFAGEEVFVEFREGMMLVIMNRRR